MPYDSNSELPKPVRDALPSAAQTVWRNVFNSQDKRGLSESRSAASAWSTLRRQGWRPPADDAAEGAKWRKVGKQYARSVHLTSERKKKKKRRGHVGMSQKRARLPSSGNSDTTSPMGKSFETTAEVLKVDDELGIVFGWGIVCTEKGERYFDLQGDHITEDAMLKATSEFMYEVRAAGEMHAKDEDGAAIHKGVIVHSMPLTEELVKAFGIECDKTGWLIGMKPDADMLDKFRDGTYRGFSIGGLRGQDEDAE